MTTAKKAHKPNEPMPYYRWYWRDWRGSRSVQKMTALERGIYRELLDEQWRSGALRNDPEWLAEAAMCTPDELASAWQTLSKCFPPVDGSDGQLLANTRLESERTENDQKRARLAVAGAMGGLAKAKQKVYSSSRAEQSSSNAAEAAPSGSALAGQPSGSEDLATPDQIRAIFDGLKGKFGAAP